MSALLDEEPGASTIKHRRHAATVAPGGRSYIRPRFSVPLSRTTQDLWVKAREAKGARKRFFEHIRTITAYLVFPDWQTLMTTLINSKPPPEIEKQIAG
jgi:hypothetical protein